MKPKLLDLFCGAGGASMGYSRAGFYIVGVDIVPQPEYPFEFHEIDAFEYPFERFDAIHASPPCQGYSYLTPKTNKAKHEKLISKVRSYLKHSKKPYIIENVAGAKAELYNPTMLCGSMFGLRCQRHRFFETSFDLSIALSCDHKNIPLLVTTASKASRLLRKKLGIPPKTIQNAPLAYGVNWMSFKGLKECIPPAYTECIGKQLMEYITKR